MNYRTIFLASVLALSVSSWAVAKGIYVAQNEAGTMSGLDAADANSLAWLNNATNWGSGVGQVNPGDTVHLVGTFTNSLTIGGSGAVGNPITILFEPGANFTSPCWPTTGAINLNGKSWIVIDGGGVGVIQSTNNGTQFGLQQDSTGISEGGYCNRVTIQNLTITNLYHRQRGSVADGNRYGAAINILAADNLTISNCVLSEGDTMIGYQYVTGTQSNLVIVANTILNCNHGIGIGTAQINSFLNNVTITRNRIDHLDVWDGNSALHLDGVIIFNESSDNSGCISNLLFSGNYIGPNIGITNTAALFQDVYSSNSVAAWIVANNLFTAVSPYGWNNGFVCVPYHALIANNTFVGYSNSCIALGLGNSPITVRNNIFYQVGTAISMGGGSRGVPIVSGFSSDYNVFWPVKGGSGYFFDPGYDADNYAGWIALGYESHSTVTSEPLVDANYVPLSTDTVAVGNGTNLTPLAIAALLVDFNGNPRPATGAWTIGAYQVASATPFVSLVASPTSITNGQSTILTWSSVNATKVTLNGIDPVPLNGSTNISPAQATTYTATATSSNGTNSASVSVTVAPAPPGPPSELHPQ
jgi:hypothetical protein